jgi:hypothetical protein
VRLFPEWAHRTQPNSGLLLALTLPGPRPPAHRPAAFRAPARRLRQRQQRQTPQQHELLLHVRPLRVLGPLRALLQHPPLLQ